MQATTPGSRLGEDALAHRAALVRDIAMAGEVGDERVLQALLRVPRHLFVEGLPLAFAYADRPEEIGYGQTISQPSTVAVMTDALELTGTERVLEIGTGSGYQAAVLALLAAQVYSVEVVPELAAEASARLRRMGYANVHVRAGDGYRGWPEEAPFARILLTAAPAEVPRALFDQLETGGILVAPVGPTQWQQRLVRYRRHLEGTVAEDLGGVSFVPMIPGQ